MSTYGQEIDNYISELKARTKEVDEDCVQISKLKGDEHAKRYNLTKEKLQKARNIQQQLQIVSRKYEGRNAEDLKRVCFLSIFYI